MMNVPIPSILIVEDEVILRWDAVSIFEDAGFTVFEAANADAALRVLEAQAGVHVVFTDVQMPGTLDGLGLAQEVRKRWPRTGVVITSGRSQPGGSDMPDDCRFIAKPYHPAVLVHKVREVVAAE